MMENIFSVKSKGKSVLRFKFADVSDYSLVPLMRDNVTGY